jgi:glutathione S-transferase
VNVFTVYGMASSGNCHKVKLALDVLKLPYQWRETDIMKGESRTPQFLAMNSNGKVPTLQIDANTYLAESGAILWYLAEGTKLVPADKLARAQMLQWMFFEQYSHEPYIAVARFVRLFQKKPDDPRMPDLIKRGYKALDVMEAHLKAHALFAGERLSLADLALFGYTHKADEAGFDLAGYPAIRAWLERCYAQPGVTAMPAP